MQTIDQLLEEYELLASREGAGQRQVAEIEKSMKDLRTRMQEIRALIKEQARAPAAPAVAVAVPKPQPPPKPAAEERPNGRTLPLPKAIKNSGKRIIDSEWVMQTYGDSRKNACQRLWRACTDGVLERVEIGRYRLAGK